MKKRFLLLLAVVLTSLTASAQKRINVDGIYYFIYSNNLTCWVTTKSRNYNPIYSGDVVIPSAVDYDGKTYSVTAISNEAFRGCTSLTSVVIPNSVTAIYGNAFEGCTSLPSIEIPSSVTNIEIHAFSGCTGLTSIVIPNSVTAIGSNAFEKCTGLTSIELPNSVTTIGYQTFYDCTSLTSIELPNSVTAIGFSAFSGCSSLASIVVPNSVTSIGGYAFSGCTSLTSVVIPNSVTSIESGAFHNCSSLPVEDNLRYADTYLVEAVDKKQSTYNIKEGTKWIGSDAFKGCESMTSVEIPNSVTEIGYQAFSGCTSLASVEIGNSVTTIGISAFRNCTSLTSVEIPSSVTEIDYDAFSGCTSLMEITSLNTTPPACKGGVFNHVNTETCVLKVPAESIEAYKAAAGWKEFYKIVDKDIPTGINNIANDATSGKTYGINGALAGEGYKGIVIRNGKKFIQGMK